MFQDFLIISIQEHYKLSNLNVLFCLGSPTFPSLVYKGENNIMERVYIAMINIGLLLVSIIFTVNIQRWVKCD